MADVLRLHMLYNKRAFRANRILEFSERPVKEFANRFLLSYLLAGWFAASTLQAHDIITTKLTWTQEISRIVYKRCAGCHRDGGPAPMPLLDYAVARPWAKAMKEEVLRRTMPPWGAVKGFGDFRGDASLTQDEISRIAQWVEGGAPEGDAAYLPPPPVAPPKVSAPAGIRRRTFKGPAVLLGLRPLQSVESAQAVATLPDGSVVPLIWLQGYKQAWNRTFIYRTPLRLPAGTRVSAQPPVPFEYLLQ